MKFLSVALLSLLVVAQFAVIGSMIRSREHILREGQAFRFRTRPIDPADPFQGRYVSLNFENDFVPAKSGDTAGLRYRSPIFVGVEADSKGFARFSGWSRTKPATGAFLKTRYLGEHSRWDQKKKLSVSQGLRIGIPFSRFYMDEAKAPRAEVAARDSTRSTNCWATVRILNGQAAIEDVFAKGQSLRDIAAQKQ
ncbi:MAG: GDYXXLXY domain-containing protein [Lentisphaerae bacterium]|nr:GDYXXLXY domain-containing protein [Lentisphaerota bacterium]